MTTFSKLDPSPENIFKLQSALNSIDCSVQDAQAKIEAMTASIKLLLTQPDSINMREHIKALCEAIESNALDAMNFTNCEAEEFGANHVCESDRAWRVQMNGRLSASQQGARLV